MAADTRRRVGVSLQPRAVTGRAISSELYARLRRPQESIYIVSPFLQDYSFLGTAALSSLLLKQLASGTQVTALTTPPPGNREKRAAKVKYLLLKMLRERGVRVLVNDMLHAKIYLFEESSITRSVIMGSANMTTPAMDKLLEVAIASYNHDFYKALFQIVIRFENDRGTMNLTRWADKSGSS